MALVETTGGSVTTITLNHPETRNAMSEAMAQEFGAVVKAVSADRAVRVVVLRGEGEVFSGGGNLAMLEEKTKLSFEENERKMLEFYNAFLSIRDIPVPVIAAINGHAIGAAAALALACDIRIAVREAKLGFNFVSLALHPGMGASYFLPRIVGPGKAAELLYSGSIVSAEEALSLGVVNRVYSAAEFYEEVRKLGTKIAANGPRAIRELKQSLRLSPGGSLEQALAQEARCQAGDYIGEEFREGITAAREKRAPRFS